MYASDASSARIMPIAKLRLASVRSSYAWLRCWYRWYTYWASSVGPSTITSAALPADWYAAAVAQMIGR